MQDMEEETPKKVTLNNKYDCIPEFQKRLYKDFIYKTGFYDLNKIAFFGKEDEVTQNQAKHIWKLMKDSHSRDSLLIDIHWEQTRNRVAHAFRLYESETDKHNDNAALWKDFFSGQHINVEYLSTDVLSWLNKHTGKR